REHRQWPELRGRYADVRRRPSSARPCHAARSGAARILGRSVVPRDRSRATSVPAGALGPRACRRPGEVEPLSHQQIPVATRMVGDRRDDLEAVLLVERRRLEGERHQHDLGATPPPRFLLGRVEQLLAEPPMALRLLDPELADLAGAAPGIAADAGDETTGVIAAEECGPLAIGKAGDGRVVLVGAILQVLHLFRRWLDRPQVAGAYELAYAGVPDRVTDGRSGGESPRELREVR